MCLCVCELEEECGRERGREDNNNNNDGTVRSMRIHDALTRRVADDFVLELQLVALHGKGVQRRDDEHERVPGGGERDTLPQQKNDYGFYSFRGLASSISLWHSSRYKTLILTICAKRYMSVPSRGSCDPPPSGRAHTTQQVARCVPPSTRRGRSSPRPGSGTHAPPPAFLIPKSPF